MCLNATQLYFTAVWGYGKIKKIEYIYNPLSQVNNLNKNSKPF